MKNFLSNSITVKVLLFLASAAIILYFYPKEAVNSYTYEVNRPWTYSLLTAPFDIPIHLDSVSRQHVRDSLDRRFEPVFVRDIEVEKTVVSEYASLLNRMAPRLQLTPTERNRLLGELRSIYDGGIVDASTYAEIQSGRLPFVRRIHDNVSVSMPTGSYKSARSAYARIDSLFHDSRFHQAITMTRLADKLVPNISCDTAETRRLRNEIYQRAMAPVGVVQQGERIIDKGELVTPQLYTVLQTYEEILAERGAGSRQSILFPLLGQSLYIAILLGTLYLYMFLFRPAYFRSTRTMLFLMAMTVAFALLAFILSSSMSGGLYLVPFAMVPVMTLIFLDSRTAYFTHTIVVMLTALIAPFPLEFIFMQLTAGIVGIDSIKDLSRRSQLVRTAVLVFVAYSLSFFAVELMHNGSPKGIPPVMFGYFAINAIFICFAYILIFVLEKLFGFTSRVTLVELSDINNPLLRTLSEECPGTFQHSMAVSNLASAAASRIGADVQLVRAGALYHDIGKTVNPAFFTENQHGVNPHDVLDPMQSARIVIGHITDGLRLAEKAKLPQKIKDFISQHHGRGTARYFYTTYCNSHPDEEVDPAPFTYPGPNPQTRETSLLMMADSVEAASRSLTDHSPAAIQALVNRIIDAQVAEGLHNESTISFRDVSDIKEVFASRLRTMFHSRISYPEKIAPKPASPAPTESETPGGSGEQR